MKALKNYYYNYGKFLWGEYGFRDAFQSLTKLVFGNLYGIEPGAYGSNDRKLSHRAYMEIIYEQYRYKKWNGEAEIGITKMIFGPLYLIWFLPFPERVGVE